MKYNKHNCPCFGLRNCIDDCKNCKYRALALDCFRDFSLRAVIKTESGRSLGATCDPGEAERIIRTYFQAEFFPEPVHVFFRIAE